MIRRTAKCEPRGPLAPDALAQPFHQARFANARFTVHQNDLPSSPLGLLPTVKQEQQVGFTPDQGREAFGFCHLWGGSGHHVH